MTVSTSSPVNPCGSCWQDNYQYAIYTMLRTPKLYKLAMAGDWDKIPARCQSHSKEAKFVHKYAPMDTALHRVLRTDSSCQQCSIEMRQSIYDMKYHAVQALLEANPLQASTADTFGRTPLHWACMDILGNSQFCQLSTEISNHEEDSCAVVELLLERSPQAINKMDIEKRTPLHYLIARNDDIPLKLLTKMVALCPETLSMKDQVGETPLDILKSRKDEIPNAEQVIETVINLNSLLTLSSSPSSKN